MSEEEIEATASEEQLTEREETETVQEEPRQVPLSALEAERRKRQEMEAQNRLYADYIERMKSEMPAREEAEEDDESELVDRRSFRREQEAAKRQIREEVFADLNPKAMAQIKQYLNPILEKKPWLRDSIVSSENRYARAYEIIEDYRHLVDQKPNLKTGNEGARIVQNANKPGSPAAIAKASSGNQMELLKSMQGKKEFREYRQKMLRG